MCKIGISHKTFENKAPFPSSEPKRTKSSLPDKLALMITKKNGSCSSRRSQCVYNNFVYNKLLAPQSARTKCKVILLSEIDVCCLGTQLYKTVIGGNYTEPL